MKYAAAFWRLSSLQTIGKFRPSLSSAQKHLIAFRLEVCLRLHLIGDQPALL